MANASAISDHLQAELLKRSLQCVAAVEAARWLDQGGLLKDSPHRPGLPLRELLRGHQILGQRQELNGRWYIDRAARVTTPAPSRSGAQSMPEPKAAATSVASHAARLADARQKY